MKFYQRILDYALVTSYSVFAVLAFDAVVDRLRAWPSDSPGALLDLLRGALGDVITMAAEESETTT